MSATAVAFPNIALIKYWGKRDEALIIPQTSSLSLTLAVYPTTTTVTLLPDGGQRWNVAGAVFGIIVANHRDIYRHPQTELADCAHRAQRHLIVSDQHGGREVTVIQHMHRLLKTRHRAPVAFQLHNGL